MSGSGEEFGSCSSEGFGSRSGEEFGSCSEVVSWWLCGVSPSCCRWSFKAIRVSRSAKAARDRSAEFVSFRRVPVGNDEYNITNPKFHPDSRSILSIRSFC